MDWTTADGAELLHITPGYSMGHTVMGMVPDFGTHMETVQCLCPSHGISFGFALRSCSTSRGSQSGLCLCSVACPHGGHLALCLASTVRRFGASTFISTAKASWGATKHGRSALRATLPLLRPSLQQRGQAASSVRDAVRHHVARAPLLRRASRSRVSGGGSTGAKRKMKNIFGATATRTACSLSAHSKIKFCSPSSRADTSN